MKKTKLPFEEKNANDSTGFLLWQVTALWQRQIAQALRPHALTQIQFVLLADLLWLSTEKQIEVTQIMLARHTKADTMTTSQVLRTLEEKGHIERKVHSEDTRAKSLHLTPAGKKIVFKAIPSVEKVDKEFFSLIQSSRVQFNSLLQLLIGKEEA